MTDRPARPRVSTLYIVTKLSLLISHSNKNDLHFNTNGVGVEHQVEVGDKYDLKLQIKNRETLQIKNRETLHTFIWKLFF